MAVAGDESSIHDYTTKWIEKVNRGDLFPVNDDSLPVNDDSFWLSSQ